MDDVTLLNANALLLSRSTSAAIGALGNNVSKDRGIIMAIIILFIEQYNIINRKRMQLRNILYKKYSICRKNDALNAFGL